MTPGLAAWHALILRVDGLRGASTLRTLRALRSWPQRWTFGRFVVESRLGVPDHGLLAPVGNAARVTHEGYTFEPRDGTADRAVLWVFNEVQTRWGLGRHLARTPRGGVFFDVGAHCGAISIPFESFFDRVVAVEPLPDNFRALARNVALNGLQRKFRLRDAAAGAARGTGTLFVHGDDEPSLVPRGAPVETVEVDIRPLDDMLDEEAISPPEVRLLKVDVEGAELQVLAGAQRLLREGSPLVVLEANTPSARGAAEAHMGGLGYTLLRVCDGRNLFFSRLPGRGARG